MNNVDLGWNKFKYFIKRHPFLSAYLAGILSWMIIQIIGGIIGNSAYDFWVSKATPWLMKEISIPHLFFIGIGIFCLFFGILLTILYYSRQEHTIDSLTISEMSSILQQVRDQEILLYNRIFEDINQQLQSELVNKSEESINRICDNYFETIFKYMGPNIINGGGILLPDRLDDEWLYFWRMAPDQANSKKRFFVGVNKNIDSDLSRGVAGNVFVENNVEIVNIIDRYTGEADNPKFRKFDLDLMGQTRYYVPYSSFICLPIRVINKSVGVLSIESQQEEIFDDESKERLQPIADLLGTILYIFGIIQIH